MYALFGQKPAELYAVPGISLLQFFLSEMAQFKFGKQPAVCRGVKPEPMAIQICDIPHVVLTSIEPCGGIAGDVCLLKKQLQGERIPAADGYPIPESADSSLGVVWHVGPVGIVPPVY